MISNTTKSLDSWNSLWKLIWRLTLKITVKQSNQRNCKIYQNIRWRIHNWCKHWHDNHLVFPPKPFVFVFTSVCVSTENWLSCKPVNQHKEKKLKNGDWINKTVYLSLKINKKKLFFSTIVQTCLKHCPNWSKLV